MSERSQYFISKDIYSGLVVFVLALPLSLGISLASGAPATAGVVSAIIGGILGSLLSGSYVTINGPAAGLIVVVYSAIQSLGGGDVVKGYKAMLGCLVVVGLLQALTGFMKLGKIGLAFPGAVIHGMMSAIGIIIIVKQFYVLLGLPSSIGEPISLLFNLPGAVFNLNMIITLIGMSSLCVIAVLTNYKSRFFNFLPPAFWAVLLGVFWAIVFDLEHQHTVAFFQSQYQVGPNDLLAIPSQMMAAYIGPSFDQLFSLNSIQVIFMIFFIASIESILCAVAVEKIDPYKRKTNLDKELVGKGICNAVSGFVGGLPMIAEVVRSSANVQNGGRTQIANFVHGLALFLSLWLLPSLLHYIPVAAFSGILIYIGYQLAKPQHLLAIHSKGKYQTLTYLVTVVTILCTDLLIGVFVGTALKFLTVAFFGKTWDLLKVKSNIEVVEGSAKLNIHSPLVFSNYLDFKRKIDGVSAVRRLTLNLENAKIVDTTVVEYLETHKEDFKRRGIEFEIEWSKEHKKITDHPHSMRVIM